MNRLFRKRFFILAVLLMLYVIAYGILRFSDVLVTRSYLVFHYNRFADETTVEYFDIGRDSAYGSQGELRSMSKFVRAFSPLCWIELRVRGYGEYPLMWAKPAVRIGEDIDKIKKTLESNTAPYVQYAPSETYHRWQTQQSYYALVEIIDAHLANRPDHNRATKKDVLKHLGKPNWSTFTEDPKCWAYQGLGRHVPYGNKVLFTFNIKDELIEIYWVSE